MSHLEPIWHTFGEPWHTEWRNREEELNHRWTQMNTDKDQVLRIEIARDAAWGHSAYKVRVNCFGM